MSRNGSGVYSLPGGSTVTNGDTSDASDVNVPLADLEADMNIPRPIVAGGTGASSAAAALVNLGLTATAAELNLMDGFAAVETTATDVTTAFPNSRALFRGRGWTFAAEQATTSGTAFDFTGIPSWVSEVIVQFFTTSLSGTDHFAVQVGTLADGFISTGYVSSSSAINAGVATSINGTSSFVVHMGVASDGALGEMVITSVGSNRWISTHNLHCTFNKTAAGGGGITLTSALDRIRITRTGSNTFDLGLVRVGWR